MYVFCVHHVGKAVRVFTHIWWLYYASCYNMPQWPLPTLRSAGLLTACYRSTCPCVWLANHNFIKLPFCSACTSSASLLELRMGNEEFEGERRIRGWKKTLAAKYYLKTFSCSRKQTATACPLHIWKKKKEEEKTVRLHNSDVWIWMAIIQHTEPTWILELLVTG